MRHDNGRAHVTSREPLSLSIEAMEPRRVYAVGPSLSLARDTGRNGPRRMRASASEA